MDRNIGGRITGWRYKRTFGRKPGEADGRLQSRSWKRKIGFEFSVLIPELISESFHFRFILWLLRKPCLAKLFVRVEIEANLII